MDDEDGRGEWDVNMGREEVYSGEKPSVSIKDGC